MRIVVKACGDFTGQLVGSVDVGDVVQVEGPYGHLTQRHFKSSEQVWIAGGIGITPFLSLARAVAASGMKATLFWSVHSSEEAYFDEELTTLSQNGGGFEYVLWKTHENGYLSGV